METDCCSRSSSSRGENIKKKRLAKGLPPTPFQNPRYITVYRYGRASKATTTAHIFGQASIS